MGGTDRGTIQIREGYLPVGEKIELWFRWFQPASRPGACVLFIHGFTEHSGRYSELMRLLSDSGFGVLAADLRGHGRSAGGRTVIRRFAEYLADLEHAVQWLRAEVPETSLVVMGHSLGGLIAALWAANSSGKAQGLVLSAPAVQIGAGVFPLIRHLAALGSLIIPRVRLVRLGVRGLSQDPAVVQDFLQDPLVFHGRIPLRSGAEILRNARRLRQQAARISLPLLILHGTADRMTDPRGSQELFEKALSPDKTLRLYPGLYHDLFHEPQASRVYADLLDWLERRWGRV